MNQQNQAPFDQQNQGQFNQQNQQFAQSPQFPQQYQQQFPQQYPQQAQTLPQPANPQQSRSADLEGKKSKDKASEPCYDCCTKNPVAQLFIGFFFSFVALALMVLSMILPRWLIRTFPDYPDNELVELIGPWQSCLSLSVGEPDGCHNEIFFSDWWVWYVTMCIMMVVVVSVAFTSLLNLILIWKTVHMKENNDTKALKAILKIIKQHNTILSLSFVGVMVSSLFWGIGMGVSEDDRQVEDVFSDESDDSGEFQSDFIASDSSVWGIGFILYLFTLPFIFLATSGPDRLELIVKNKLTRRIGAEEVKRLEDSSSSSNS